MSAKKNPDEWFYAPIWKAALPPEEPAPSGASERSLRWLVLTDGHGFGDRLVQILRAQGVPVVTARPGQAFTGNARSGFTLDPHVGQHYTKLLEAAAEQGQPIERIVHGFAVGPPRSGALTVEEAARAHDLGYYSLLYLARALAAEGRGGGEVQLVVATTGLHDVSGLEPFAPERATLLGSVMVIPQEHQNVTVLSLDFEPALEGGELAERILAAVSRPKS